MKSYEFEITVTKDVRNGSITIQRKAQLVLDDSCLFHTILLFVEDFRKALSEAKKAAKKKEYVTAEFFISSYSGWEEEGKILKQKSFDCWRFEGYLEEEDGLYLPPDLRYTEATKDIWLDYEHPLEGLLYR